MDYTVFEGKSILITGATGLIGKALVKKLIKENQNRKNKVNVIAVVRNFEKAQRIFKEDICEELKFLVTDVCGFEAKKMNVDYIIHAASQTSSKGFVNIPVDTIMTALQGTRNFLELAKMNEVKGFVYLSSMEVYGTPITDEKICENHATNLDAMKVRSCYPESKRMCESLCASYAAQYGIPAMVVRLTQTFGPGVVYSDERVFAEFARCAIEEKNIILKTKGETKRSYLYTEDAVEAILTVLIEGKKGEAYNAANENTYCSIYEMAELVAQNCTKTPIAVIIKESNEIEKLGYAATLHMNLDTSKLKELGWQAKTGLTEMYQYMIEDMKNKIEE